MTSFRKIPEGYHALTPYLIVNGAAKAIDFYVKALGAKERYRMPMGDGRVGHAELDIGGSVIMVADEFPQMGVRGPTAAVPSPVTFTIYVDDVDTTFIRAIAAGGIEERPVANKFYGDRSGTFVDPCGHKWTLSTRVENVSPSEMRKRMAEQGS